MLNTEIQHYGANSTLLFPSLALQIRRRFARIVNKTVELFTFLSMARRSPTETIRFLTQDQTTRLFSVIRSKRDRAIFLIAYRHGLRASEVGRLVESDVDFKKLRIMLHRLKGSYSHEHPLQADEAKALKAHLRSRKMQTPVLFTSNRNDPISRSMLHKLTQKYGTLAKVPTDRQHFHVLKHSVATHLLDAGADVRFVQDWLGHANIQNTVWYAHLVSRTREEKARTFFLKLPRY